MQIFSDDPAAEHVTKAGECYEAGDVDGCDAAYGRAVRAAERAGLREELQEDHLSVLMKLRKRELALRRCEEYLGEHPPGPTGLRVLHAEILTSLGDHGRADAEALAVSQHEGELDAEEVARLHRVRGLALANDGSSEAAMRHLSAAKERFGDLGTSDLLLQMSEEIEVLLKREGHMAATIGGVPETVPDHLLRAEELRHQARYEEAFWTLVRALRLPDLEPALYWPVMREMTTLAWALRLPGLVERLGPFLWEAAGLAPEPQAAQAEAVSLRRPGAPKTGPVSRRFDAGVAHVRRLLDDARQADAEESLKELRDRAASPRDLALWHLAAAEAELIRSRHVRGDAAPSRECAGHAALSATYAWTDSLLEVRIAALRILGHALAGMGLPDSDDRAVDCWGQAHRLEEEIAIRQPGDPIRIHMLRAMPDEHDERVRSALERTQRLETPTAAGIAVALEAARGALILPRILPGGPRARDLPRPSDWAGARDWVGRMAAALPRDQAVWLIHATPDRVHHVVICRELLHHTYVQSSRQELYQAIGSLARCWESPVTLEASAASGEFARRLKGIALRLGVGAVTGRLPAQVRRLAVVAGNELSDVPLAALPLPDSEPLGLRYALSDLPCLSALAPLRERSDTRRGDDALLVRPDDDGLAPSRARVLDTLPGAAATPDGLREGLAARRHQIVRIDGHGVYGHDDARFSVIKLWPPGMPGHLRAEDLEGMDLHGCGTLVLGACESGMAQRLGRDERRGFVRAAFNAGAASVVAARWIAPDLPAAELLDRFQGHLRRLPRDLALRAAMRDVHAGDVAVPFPRDPSRWACWSLYGDSGLQTKAGPLRRWMRRWIVQKGH
ncbi:CHAT domain-containing protein [Actinomadura graeca]|uniref:CHAT domain-containing protein n=1 Tax=Actinomadura graeca TaxID=2750812 RepID=A0ABX8QRC3_9ACTN|nr:CHAT domain-containing protein [Actinomadura graeca]QXJ21183.1 CHAT domain-containing protein [Actinomadura graeca]